MNDFLAQMTALTGQSQEWFQRAFLVFLRVGALMALLPGFGEQMIPARIRLGLALAFTAVVLPMLAGHLPSEMTARAAMGEVAAGLLLGAGLRLFVHALQIAGTIIAQSTSLSQMFGGVDNEPSPALGTILTLAGLTLAMAMGLHVRAAQLIILSYDILPGGSIPDAAMVAEWGVGQVARIFALAFSLAAPFMIAALVYNLATGVINRAMPQLMAAMVGAPALTLGGLALLAVAAPMILTIWGRAFGLWFMQPFGGG